MTVRRSAQRKVQGKPCPSATLQPWANRRQEGFRGWSRWPGGTTQGSNTGSCMGTLGGAAPGAPRSPNPQPAGADAAAAGCRLRKREQGWQEIFPCSCGHHGLGR